MTSPDFRLRPSAVIINDGAILLIEYDEPGVGQHYNLPGGGLNPEEMLYDGLRRELREEACVEIEIGSLLMVWELPQGKDSPNHHIGMLFRCDLAVGSQPHVPDNCDAYQTGVCWVMLADLPRIMLLPELMARKLPAVLAAPAAVDPFVTGQW